MDDGHKKLVMFQWNSRPRQNKHWFNWFIITLPLRLSASGQRINIIMLTNDTSFRPCSVSLYLSLPRKLIGPLDPSSPVRLMAATWSLPDRGWWRQWDCFLFCFTPLGGPGSPYFQSSYPCLIVGAVSWFALPSSPLALTFSSPTMRPGITSLLSVLMSLSCPPHWQCQVHW